MIRLLRRRFIYAGIFLACIALLAFALFLQHVKGLEPCPLCVLQRVAFVGVGITALIAALHHPLGWGRYVYGIFVVIFSLAGVGVAARHVWVQYFPPPAMGCAADLGYLLELPLAYAFPAIFRGTGECGESPWSFLWLSIPEWALVWFVIFTVTAVFATVKARA
jgi:disulfide bond formation protein DsbB